MLIVRTIADIISDNPWQRAYWVTVMLTALNAAAASMIWGFGVENHLVNGIAATSIGLVGIYCGGRMALSGAMLGALPYFMIGSALFYGLGTVIAVIHTDAMSMLSFTGDVQRSVLAKINLAHAMSILLVVLSAGIMCAGQRPEPRPAHQPGVRSVIGSLEGALTGLMIVSVAVTFVMWATFPWPENPVLAALLRLLRGLPLFTILLGATVWDRITGPGKVMILLLVLGQSLFGLLGFSKMLTLLPTLILVLGWWLNGTMARVALIVTLAIGVVYFVALAEFVAIGRLHTNYDPLLNSAWERLVILLDSVDLFVDLQKNDINANVELRFATAPFEAYFMTLYDTGFPGDSLEEAKTILIPRILWPEKPAFAPGSEFDLIFRGAMSDNNLAIGFIAEGYWNYGWLGILIVSVVAGVQIGWFTRKWLLFTEHGVWHLGIFLLAPLVVYQAAWAEVNFVGGYVGGTVRLILIIMFIDCISRLVLSYQRAQLRV